MATVRKRTLRLSGSSVRPAYPGFMVMNMVHVGSRESSVPSNMNLKNKMAVQVREEEEEDM